MKSKLLFLLLALLPLPVSGQEEEPFEYFEEERKVVEVSAFLDLRLARTDAPESFLDGAFGKTRYGGDGLEKRTLARISQASLVFDLRPADSLTAHFQLNFDLEPEFPHGRFGWDRLRVIELFLDWTPSLGESWELGTKLGFFFPPVSLEHVGEAWTTVYTLTPSAINGWIGEEVRVTGAEFSLTRVGLENQAAARGAVFYNNDPTGSLIGYRGFALHDRQTGLRDRLPLPPIPSISESGTFKTQAPWVEPFREIDDRPGYYAGASFENYQHFRLQGLFFDNRAIPTAFDGFQYGWQTRFASLGALVFLPGGSELFGQFLDGDLHMGLYGPGMPQVAANFRSWYALVTVPFGRQRVSFRYEQFEVEDLDGLFPPFDFSDEDGSAWTLFYNVRLGESHGLAFELLRVSSDHTARITSGLEPEVSELQMQLSLRLRF